MSEEKKRGGFRKNAKRPTISDKPKVQYGGGRIDANLAAYWKKYTGNKTAALEKAMWLLLKTEYMTEDELYPSVFDEV